MTLQEYIELRKLLRGDEEKSRRQEQQLEAIRRQTDKIGWWSDFSSNIAGNAAWNVLQWLFKSIK
jgi:cellobiose phosphorylase